MNTSGREPVRQGSASSALLPGPATGVLASPLGSNNEDAFNDDEEETFIKHGRHKNKLVRKGVLQQRKHLITQLIADLRKDLATEYDNIGRGIQPRLTKSEPLRLDVEDKRAEANAMAIGGMRHPRHSVNQIPGLKKAGALVRQATDELMAAYPAVIDECSNACGSGEREQVPAKHIIQELATRMTTLLGTSPRHLPVDPRVDTELDAQLLENWRHAAGDVDTDVPDWLSAGAASGINDLPASKGIFPSTRRCPKSFDL